MLVDASEGIVALEISTAGGYGATLAEQDSSLHIVITNTNERSGTLFFGEALQHDT